MLIHSIVSQREIKDNNRVAKINYMTSFKNNDYYVNKKNNFISANKILAYTGIVLVSVYAFNGISRNAFLILEVPTVFLYIGRRFKRGFVQQGGCRTLEKMWKLKKKAANSN